MRRICTSEAVWSIIRLDSRHRDISSPPPALLYPLAYAHWTRTCHIILRDASCVVYTVTQTKPARQKEGDPSSVARQPQNKWIPQMLQNTTKRERLPSTTYLRVERRRHSHPPEEPNRSPRAPVAVVEGSVGVIEPLSYTLLGYRRRCSEADGISSGCGGSGTGVVGGGVENKLAAWCVNGNCCVVGCL